MSNPTIRYPQLCNQQYYDFESAIKEYKNQKQLLKQLMQEQKQLEDAE